MRFKALYAILTMVLFSLVARATLGEKIDTIRDNARTFRTSSEIKSKTSNLYSVHSIQFGSGNVKQFATSDGDVFAISWEGQRTPDLEPLLGNYFEDYKIALGKTDRTFGRRFQNIKGRKVIVEKWGVMRSLQGRAYDPSLVPIGVNIREIR